MMMMTFIVKFFVQKQISICIYYNLVFFFDMKNIFLCIKMLCYFCVSENIQLSVHTNYMKYNDQQV